MEKQKKPALRFKGFQDDWEQRKLGDIVAIYDGVHQTPSYTDSGVMFLSVENIKTMQSNKFISEESFKRDFKVFPQKGDVLMTRIGDVGTPNIVESDEELAYYVSLALLKPKMINSFFLCTAIQSSMFQKELKNRTLLTAIPQKINKDEIGKVNFLMPVSIKEQEAIGKYYQKLNTLITLHQRKLHILQNLKKAMLEKMFPKNGAKVPEIRFAGFTDDWEQRKLGHLALFSKGRGYSKSDLQDSGTPVILYGRLYTKYETVIKDVDTYVLAQKGSVFSKSGDVIVPASGETAEDISVASVVRKTGILLGGDLNIIHPNNTVDPTFLALSITNGQPHNDMAKRAQGKSVVHLHNEDLAQIDLFYPSIEEQENISKFIENLDAILTLHQREQNIYCSVHFSAFFIFIQQGAKGHERICERSRF